MKVERTGQRIVVPPLVSAEELSEKSGIPVNRIVDLTEAGFMPHWRIDGGTPHYSLSECKGWIKDNLTKKHEGRDLPTIITVSRHNETLAPDELPTPLKNVKSLVEMTHVIGRNSGVYFLCWDDEIVYVGQTNNVYQRVTNHMADKEFERVYFLRWPSHDLDRIERSFIRILRPKYNFPDKGHGLMPRFGEIKNEPAYKLGAILQTGTTAGTMPESEVEGESAIQ